MNFLPFAFTTPAILTALVLLPVIWWLLRLTPPRPAEEEQALQREIARFPKREEQPSRSPWWLTLLRLGLAGAVIVALAGPIYRPVAETAPGTGPLLLVVENGWAAAPQWPAIVETARRIVGLAENEDRPLALLATAEGAGQSLAPTDAASVLKRLAALEPRPFAANHAAVLPALTEANRLTPFGGAAWLSDGSGGKDVDDFASALGDRIAGPTSIYADPGADLFGLKPPVGNARALAVPVIRRDTAAAAGGTLRALDLKGRVIGEAPFTFAPGAAEANGEFALPVELRNEIVRLEVANMETAGSVQLLDERWRRRKIGLLSGANADTAQPLLSPLYYISRAVQPFADVEEPRDANATVAVPDLIESGVSIIAMADIGTLTPDVEETVANWVRDGGTLVRFAGPRLAAATDALIPVRLRHGDRVLGGTLTWQTPQPLASFSANSPFAGMAVPADVLVTRQVLAEPDGTLSERTWAALADGTPLVTAEPSGKGWLILFHVTADTSWSNLPLSGTFVDMLKRVIAFSTAVRSGGNGGDSAQTIAPYRLLDGYGRFSVPGTEAEPIAAGATDVAVDAAHPPGLYGTEAGFRSLNLLAADATLPPLDVSALRGADLRTYPTATPTEIGPWLLAIAFGLLILDAIAVLWLAGAFGGGPLRRASAAVLAALILGGAGYADRARADAASDKFAMEAVSSTRLAYVLTGNASIDSTSRAGLRGLSEALKQRTALEPGEPMGVDPAKDELAFFALIYWPIDAAAPMPSSATMSKIDAYMRQGGSVLFDTRDQLERSTNAGTFSGTPAVERLRDMLATLDIPPLEPVPADHVLTKAFYLLNDFPGRYAGGPLWVEATQSGEARTDRPAQAGDGVSTILITENDFASAWAIDEGGAFILPTVPADPEQREMAFRTGINIVMYTLTGNYKADQVHVPALLERLGQ
ncbi:MAG: DUF4159 domain-containing protein [Bauldia sp.]